MDAMSRTGWWILVFGLAPLLLLWGCAPRATEADFESPNPASKLYAIRQAGAERDVSKVPALIEQLDSDDPAVRMYSIIALDKIVGRRLGYSPYDPPWKREPTVQAWVEAYRSGQVKRWVAGEDASGGQSERGAETAVD
jgi:hypothetical protein